MQEINEKKLKKNKARIAYENYLSRLPRCDKCEQCMFVGDRKNASNRRVCTVKHELIDNRVVASPTWCPKRK